MTGNRTSGSLVTYYELRASEYDAIYEKPERQEDLARLRARLSELFAGRQVLEIAAGTGYWTQTIARVAHRVLATDVNQAPLTIARARDYGDANVDFQVADGFNLEGVEGDFDAAFVGFLFSHLREAELTSLLSGLGRQLAPKSLVVAIDNRYVDGSSSPIVRTDADGNTYQERRLADGTGWEVLKNFWAPEPLYLVARPHSDDVSLELLTYYWMIRMTTR